MSTEERAVQVEAPLPVRIAEELKRLIYSGEIQPGERLNEVALAVRMGTSRGPIREAIRIITGFGLVSAVPNRGVYVRQLSVKEVVEVSDLRALVFQFAAGLAVENSSPADCAALSRVVDAMDIATSAQDKDEYYKLNLEFHHLVVSLAHSDRTMRLYNDLVKELHLFRRQNFDNASNMRKSNAEHRRIYDAIAAGNKSLACELAQQHILAGCQRMLRTINMPA